jgi:hypothetical protein
MPNWQSDTRIDDSINNFSTGGGMILVLEGDYLLQLHRVVPSPANRDYGKSDPYLRFDFKIVEGPDGLGKSLGYVGMISKKNADGSGGSWGLGRVLNAVGLDPSKFEGRGWASYEEFASFVQALSGRLAQDPPKSGGTVNDDTTRGANSQIVSRIVDFWPAEEWEERTKPRTETATAAAPARARGRAPAAAAAAPAATAPVAVAEAPAPNGAAEAPVDEAGLASRLDSLFKAG